MLVRAARLCKDVNSCCQRLLLAEGGVLAIGKNQGVLLHHNQFLLQLLFYL